MRDTVNRPCTWRVRATQATRHGCYCLPPQQGGGGLFESGQRVGDVHNNASLSLAGVHAADISRLARLEGVVTGRNNSGGRS